MKTRMVKTHLDENGMLMFRLLQGANKQRTVHTFGYGTHHRVWVRVLGNGSGTVTMISEPAFLVKEEIARWAR